VLNDVCACYSKISATTTRGIDTEQPNHEDPVNVLVDCMLGLLTKPSALVRDVVRVVFM
jgi:hypothetical protein